MANLEVPHQQAAPVAAPAHDDDIGHWVNRLKDAANKPEAISGWKGEQPWKNRTFEFFDPIDSCLLTCCCPCVTFGKTHHRLRKDPTLKDFNPINPSCIGFFFANYICLGVPLVLLQRHDIRTRYNLQGDCAMDVLRACCCGCCDLIQQDKEAAYHTLNSQVVSHQPSISTMEMKMPAPQ